jgi:tetrahydromethanopterin S-methyltransferase subunit A
LRKVQPHPGYPSEEGRFERGNDRSPTAVAVILNCPPEKTPPEIENLVQAGLESGAALAGTVQTENLGIEKMVCNLVANPNIRYLVLGGPESEGHRTGDAIKALFANGLDDKKRIAGSEAPNPFLYNLPPNFVERLLDQITLIDLQFQGDPDVIREAVWSCWREEPVDFRNYSLHDPGAYPEPPLSGKIAWRVAEPWAEPVDDKEKQAQKKALKLMERLRKQSAKKK